MNDEQADELIEALKTLTEAIKGVSISPAKAEGCPHEHTRELTSHSEKNPGRKFKSCLDCKGFAGWVD